jgi:hypothetical protein
MGLPWEDPGSGYLIEAGTAIPAESRSAIRRFGDRRPRSRGIRMTIKHQMWLADALASSVLMFALYLILLEFSKATLP